MRRVLAFVLPAVALLMAVQAVMASEPKKEKSVDEIVADAFKVAAGKLRPDQQNELKTIKDQYTPRLKSAVQKLQDAKEQKDKEPAAREVLKLKKEVKDRIDALLQKPDPAAVKAAQQAQQRAQQQRQQQNKAQQQHKAQNKKH